MHRLALALTLVTACQASPQLPSPPAPLRAGSPPQTSGATAAAVRVDAPFPLSGSFHVTTELSQEPLDPPPVRVRFEADIERTAGGASAVSRLETAPEELAELARGVDVLPPVAALARVADPDSLGRWLSSPPSSGACAIPSPAPVAVEIQRQAVPEGVLVRWSTPVPDGPMHRGEVAGTLLLSPSGDALSGRVEARRWTRYEAAGCALVEVERVVVEVR